MAEKTLFDKKFIGNPVEIGTSASHYKDFLMKDEAVKMEFKGLWDTLLHRSQVDCDRSARSAREEGRYQLHSMEVGDGVLP